MNTKTTFLVLSFFLGMASLRAQNAADLLSRIADDRADLDSLQIYSKSKSADIKKLDRSLYSLKRNLDQSKEAKPDLLRLHEKFNKEFQKIKGVFDIRETLATTAIQLDRLQECLSSDPLSETELEQCRTAYHTMERLPRPKVYRRKLSSSLFFGQKRMMKHLLSYFKSSRKDGNFLGVFNLGQGDNKTEDQELDQFMGFLQETMGVYAKLDETLGGSGNGASSNFDENANIDSLTKQAFEQLHQLVEDAEQLRGKKEWLEQKNDSLNRANQDLDAHNSRLSYSIENLQKTIAGYVISIENLQKTVVSYENSLLKLKNEIERLSEVKNELQVYNEELNKKSVADKARLRKQLEEIDRLLVDKEKEAKGLGLEVAKLKLEWSTVTDSLEKAELEVASIVKSRDRLTKQRNVLWLPLLTFASVLAIFAFYWLYKEKDELRKSNNLLQLTFRELHHRTKNSLRMISGMLGMQARVLSNQEAKDALQAGRDRLSAVLLVHSKLYLGNSLTKVKMDEYVDTLLTHLKESFDFEDRPLTLHSGVQNIEMEADFAIPIGILINEVVTNAFKHAFLEHPNPELTIQLSLRPDDPTFRENEAWLMIKDNGQKGPWDAKHKSFGMQAIQGLVERQLDGSYSYRYDSGTIFQAKIKYK